MSIKIDCKNQRVEDIMRDVKEKSESVIHGGWHVVIGKSNDPIMEFINLDSLNEEEQYELLRNLDVMINQLQPMHNSYCGNNPIFTSNIFTMRKIGVLNSLYQQVLCKIKKNKNEETDNKLVIINCKDKDIVDILKHISNALYGDISNSSPNIEFKNLVSLTIDDLKKLNKQLDGLYTTIRNSISPLTTVDVSQKTWRLHRILDLQRQVIKEAQRKENESRKSEEEKKQLEEEYFKKTNDELKGELVELKAKKEDLTKYRTSRIHPICKDNLEKVIKNTDSKIDVINKILAHRELEESKHIDEIRNEKWNRYNNLEVEELEMILDALNVRCNLYRFEDKYKCEAIQKAKEDVLKNMKIIKDILKCKKGVK